MNRTDNNTNHWDSSAFLNQIAQGIILIIFTSILAKGFFFSEEYLFYRYDDDFYYYIGIAQHLSQDLVSTFNGEHLSNGYHPLWMVVLTAMLKIAPYESIGFHLMLTLIIVGSFAITIRLIDQLFSFFKIPYWVRILHLPIFFFTSRLLYFGGMEVILTIPLALYILNYYLRKENPNFLFLGFVSSLMILSRLDSIFLVFFMLLQIGFSYRFSIKQLLKPLLLFGAGGIALPIYLASNLYFFESLLPLSGMAKQMREVSGFSFRPFLDWATTHHPHKLILFVVWIAEIGAIAYILSRYKHLNSAIKRLLPFLGFTLIFFIVHSLLSDWHWWPWYLYSVLIAMPLGIIVVWDSSLGEFEIWNKIESSRLKWLALSPVALLFCYGAYQLTTPTRIANNFKEVKSMVDFINQHSNVNVGMGDAAGIVTMLLDESNTIIQLEGLVMDKPFLELLATKPLAKEVFDQYDIRFYVMMKPTQTEEGCYESFFPKQAGNKSVRIPTKFCAKAAFSSKHFQVFDRYAN